MMNICRNRLVVKIGTSAFTNKAGQNDLLAFGRLALIISDIQNMGCQVILVSSGTIAAGDNKEISV